MSKSNDDKPITAKKFMKEFHRYQKWFDYAPAFSGCNRTGYRDGGDGYCSAIAVVREGQCIR